MTLDKQANVSLAAETVDELRAEAARNGVGMSEVARWRIEGYPPAVAEAEDRRRAVLARFEELEGECERQRAETEILIGALDLREPERSARIDGTDPGMG